MSTAVTRAGTRLDMLAGHTPHRPYVDAVTIATRQYAKRQETWFRHQMGSDVLTLDATRPPEQLAAAIRAAAEAIAAVTIRWPLKKRTAPFC